MKFIRLLPVIMFIFLTASFSYAQQFDMAHPLILSQVRGKSILAVDLNLDNKMDLVSGTYNNTSKLHNFINPGNGQFNTDADFTLDIKNYPNNLTTADLNNDGLPDIVTVNYTDSTVSICFTNSSGDYDSVKTVYLPYSYVIDVAVGFLNNDSIPDLAVVTQRSTRLVVLMGNGQASFDTAVAYSTSGSPWDLKIVDVDNDNDNDIVVGNGGGSYFYVHKNNGSGDFSEKTTQATASPPTFLEVADMNGDNYPDMVIAKGGYDHGTLEVSLNDQSGSFSQSALITTGKYMAGIRVGKIDDDDYWDAVTIDQSGLYVSYGDGAGGFTYTDTLADTSSEKHKMVELADVNNDGELDIIVSRKNSILIYFSGENTAINDINSNKISRFELRQNYPNPFNPSTVISYQLSVVSRVELAVYNLLGQKVRTLVKARQAAGAYQVTFDAADLPSGVYYYKLQSGSFTEVRRMVLLK